MDVFIEDVGTTDLTALATTTPVIVFDSSAHWGSVTKSLLMKTLQLFGKVSIPKDDPEDIGMILALTQGGLTAAEVNSAFNTSNPPLGGENLDRTAYQNLVKQVIAIGSPTGHAGVVAKSESGTPTHHSYPFDFNMKLPAKGFVFDSDQMFDIWAVSISESAHADPSIELGFKSLGVILND